MTSYLQYKAHIHNNTVYIQISQIPTKQNTITSIYYKGKHIVIVKLTKFWQHYIFP